LGGVPSRFLEIAEEKEFQTDKQFWDLIKNIGLGDNISLIDLGCGPGRDLKFAKENLSIKQIAGVDTSKDMCDIAHKATLGDIRNESYTKTSFSDKAFDLVISRYALQTSKNPDDCWREVNRIIKPGGYGAFLITHPISNYEKKQLNYFVQEDLEAKIFDEIKITEPSHTFQDWISDYLLDNFDLLRLKEGKQTAERKYPSYFILILKQKTK
jgi:ubiquinone/menaquinone biosynthesis C-methylase UbiE